MAASSPMDSVTSFGETVKVSPAVRYGMSMGIGTPAYFRPQSTPKARSAKMMIKRRNAANGLFLGR